MGKIIGFQNAIKYAHEHPLISQMVPGEFGWIVPWMARMTKDGTIYVMNTPVDVKQEDKPQGTRKLRIERISQDQDGYSLDFSKIDETIEIVESEENLAEGFVCPSEFIKIGKIEVTS